MCMYIYILYVYLYIYIHTYPPFLTNIWGISPSRCQLPWRQGTFRHLPPHGRGIGDQGGPGGTSGAPICGPGASQPLEIHGKSMGKSMEYATFIW